MNKLSTLLCFALLTTSCAQLANKVQNSTSGEKESSYKVGDLVTVEINNRGYRVGKATVSYGEQVRSGQKSNANIFVTGIAKIKSLKPNIALRTPKYPLSEYKFKAVVRITNIEKECSKVVYKNKNLGVLGGTKCASRFQDSAKFVKWHDSLMTKVATYNEAYLKAQRAKKKQDREFALTEKRAEKYVSSGSFDKDVVCIYSDLMEDLETAIRGKGNYKNGFTSLALLEKSDLKKEKGKAKRLIKYHKAQYMKKRGKSVSKSCDSHKVVANRFCDNNILGLCVAFEKLQLLN